MENLKYNTPVVKSTFTEKEYPLVTDADVYVSVSGDDSADGSFAHPVRTFEGARDLVRKKKKTAKGEIRVAFMAGEYGRLEGLSLTAEDAGTEETPIKYCKYGDGDVVFDNGLSLFGKDFKKLSDGEKALFPEKAADHIRKLSLDSVFPDGMPEDVKIFGGDKPIWEARFPNKNDGRDVYMKFMLQVFENKKNIYDPRLKILSPLTGQLEKIADFTDVKLVGYIMYGWRVNSFYIDSYDKTTHIMEFDRERLPSDFYTGAAGAGIRTPQMPLDEVYLSNAPELLDDNGEYWYDKKNNVIYVYEPVEEYTIGLGGKFASLEGADYVTFEGLTFKNNTDTAITCTDSAHVTFDGVKMSGVAACITASGNSDFFTVRNSEFERFIGCCIRLAPTRHRTTLESNHMVVDNNYVHDFGDSTRFNNQAVADGAIGSVISHNFFKTSPNGAVNLGMLSTVEYNVFDNLMTCTQDYGIVYTWEAISTARQNHIRYNLFTNMCGGQTYGNYIDDFSQDQYIYGNIFYKCGACGVMLHNARNCFVYDNFFYGCGMNSNGYGYYKDGGVQEGLLPDGTGWEAEFERYYRGRINEGEEGYEVWKAQFPSLYELEPDVEHPENYNSFFCPWNSIHHNLLVNATSNVFNCATERLGDVHDNEWLDDSENPYFVDPTRGDYTLKDGVTFFEIPFEKIGRY
ncbi:MAG: hypothetical protein MJ096_00285 [Clostridia bacterium]|nr:hypothetical protein [Clostridia bacterium]